MKRILPFLLIATLAAGCGGLTAPVPTPDDAMISTQVAAILTTEPTETLAVVESSPTAELPTVAPTDEPKELPTETATITFAPTDTPTLAATEVLPTVAENSAETTAPTVETTPDATLTPSADDPAVRLGTPTWTDDMTSDTNWPVGSDDFTAVEFSDGAMKLTGLTTTDGWRLALPQTSNVYLEMTFKTNACTGSDRYGMFFRVPEASNPNRGYLFGFSCDGKYSLRRWNAEIGAKGEMVTLVNWAASPAILTGSNQTNRMGILAVGDRLVLYANGQKLTEVKDNTFTSGYFGVFVGSRESTDLKINVEDVRYWDNPSL